MLNKIRDTTISLQWIKWKLTFLAACSSIVLSCVAPVTIPLGGNSDWVVFGLMGEDKPPVVFVYGVDVSGGFMTYHPNANIEVVDEQSNQSFRLEKIINGNLDNVGTNEYPFTQDTDGNIIYYSSGNFRPRSGGLYTINFNLGDEEGVAEVEMPTVVNLSRTEIITNNNDVDRLYMSIDDIEGEDYYKWEILIDQLLPLQLPLFDSTGEMTGIIDTTLTIHEVITPNNYITESKIAENQNEFRYNLTSNIPDYTDQVETYFLNVRLRHYGKEVVEYFESLSEQGSTYITDPFTEPVFIRSNIDGLIGMIGTYSYSADLFLEYQR